MKLLRDWNWYLLCWLEWHPQLEHLPRATTPWLARVTTPPVRVRATTGSAWGCWRP